MKPHTAEHYHMTIPPLPPFAGHIVNKNKNVEQILLLDWKFTVQWKSILIFFFTTCNIHLFCFGVIHETFVMYHTNHVMFLSVWLVYWVIFLLYIFSINLDLKLYDCRILSEVTNKRETTPESTNHWSSDVLLFEFKYAGDERWNYCAKVNIFRLFTFYIPTTCVFDGVCVCVWISLCIFVCADWCIAYVCCFRTCEA